MPGPVLHVGQDLGADLFQDPVAGIERRQDHDLIQTGLVESGQALDQLIPGSDQAGRLDQVPGEEPAFLRHDPAVVSGVNPLMPPLRLDLLAEEVAASVRPDESEVVAEPGSPVVVNADMALVRQALDNVVRNAVRRAPNVELTSAIDGRFGVVSVIDDGPGFDEEMLPRVFDRYQRGDRRGEVGVGLAIVKAIVEANGGSVTASNGESGGAVVTLKIPLADT